MKKIGIPIIRSVMGLSVNGYVKSAKILESAGADAIEIDLCCTIPEFITKYKSAGQNANFIPKIYAKIIKKCLTQKEYYPYTFLLWRFIFCIL